MKGKDFTPLIMWSCLFTGIVVLAFIRQSRTVTFWDEYAVNFDTVFIGSYVLWMLIELRVSREDVNTESKKTSDRATCQLYGLAQALTILTALWFSSVWRAPNVAHFAGIGLFLLGVSYRTWAICTLGQFYSHRVRTLAQHQIVVSGPYRFIRHPAYAGMIIAHAGIAMYFFNWVTMCVFLFFLVPSILVRILMEEKILFAIKGYAEFAKTRRRLFPVIW